MYEAQFVFVKKKDVSNEKHQMYTNTKWVIQSTVHSGGQMNTFMLYIVPQNLDQAKHSLTGLIYHREN
jgi:hypothetical protein